MISLSLSLRQTKGHSTIVGGYSDGLVAVWNLNQIDSPLLCPQKNDGFYSLLPFQVFYAVGGIVKRKFYAI